MINNITAHAQSFWSFGPLDKALPGKLGFSDVDAITERNGHFLVIEFKGRGVKIPVGQQILLKRLANLPEFTVVVVWGDRDDPSELQIVGHHESPVPCSMNYLQKVISRWFDSVDHTN